MIQYLYQEGVESCSIEPLCVRKDGKEIGAIEKVMSGFQFIPKQYDYSFFNHSFFNPANLKSPVMRSIEDIQEWIRLFF